MPTKDMQIRPVGTDDYATVLHPETNIGVILDKSTGKKLAEILLTDINTAKDAKTIDLNNLITPGFYIVNASTPNAPYDINTSYIVMVMPENNDSIVQVAYPITGGASVPLKMRCKFRGRWTSWWNLEDEKWTTSTIALGLGANSAGNAAIAIGENSYAKGDYSVAIGQDSYSLNSYEGTLGVGASGTGARNWRVLGSFSVTGTKNWEMAHPHPNKKDSHVIRHGAVESPTPGDTLYRYNVEIVDDKAKVSLIGQQESILLPYESKEDTTVIIQIPLPDYWVHLNINEQVFVNANRHFGKGYGYIDKEKEVLVLILESLKNYYVALYGTRNDDNVQDWYVRGVEREAGESWLGETYVFETNEFFETTEFEEVI